MKATPETIQASFDEVQRFAKSAPLFKWAEIEDVEFTEIRYPPPIIPDPIPEDLDLIVADFKPIKPNKKWQKH